MAVVDVWYRRDKATGKKVRSARYGKGLRWRVQWVTEDGRRHSKMFSSKDEAEANYSAIKADLRRGAYIDPEDGQITLREFGEKWLASRDHEPLTRVRTRDRLERQIYPQLGHIPLRKIRASTVQAWLTTLANTEVGNRRHVDGEIPEMLGGTTRERIHATLSTVLQAAVDDGILVRNPSTMKSLSKPKKDTAPARPWPRERIVAMERHLPERWRPLVLLGIGLGLRRGEMFGLSVDDIDFLRGTVHVRRQVILHPKNKLTYSLPKYRKTRILPLPEGVGQQLAAYMKKFPPREVTLPWREVDGPPVTERLLLTTRESGAANGNYITQVWKKAARRFGFDPTNRDGLHVLRHTYASVLLDAGESIVTVAARLGHADPSFTLKVYAHLMPDSDPRTRTAIDAFLLGDDHGERDARDGADGATAAG